MPSLLATDPLSGSLLPLGQLEDHIRMAGNPYIVIVVVDFIMLWLFCTAGSKAIFIKLHECTSYVTLKLINLILLLSYNLVNCSSPS